MVTVSRTHDTVRSCTIERILMQQRNLGQHGLVSSAIGLGTMGMTMAYGAGDEPGGIATIRRAHELGVTMLDTAELYGGGTGSNERLVGRAVAGFRDEMVLATKFGFVLPFDPNGRMTAALSTSAR
jgi:aryl-alcohol dehydrogenase-like predicted oxidoreductase